VSMGVGGILGGAWLGFWIPRRVPPPTPQERVVADGRPA